MGDFLSRYRWHDLPPCAHTRRGWPWRRHCRPLPRRMDDGRAWPTIGLVVPSYNQGAFLEETLRSVLLQNYPQTLCVVEDALSRDGSREILARYRRHLTHVASEADRGQAHAINKGMARLDGAEWVGWLNSDDLLLPGALKAIGRAAAAAPPDVVAFVGRGFHVKPDGRRVDSVPPERLDGETIANWRRGHFLQPCCFFRLSAFCDAGGLDESLDHALDFDLWLRLAERGRFQVLDDPIAADRHHPDAKTQRDPGLYFAEAVETLLRRGQREAARDLIRDLHAEYRYLARVTGTVTRHPLYRRFVQPFVQRRFDAPPSLRSRK